MKWNLLLNDNCKLSNVPSGITNDRSAVAFRQLPLSGELFEPNFISEYNSPAMYKSIMNDYHRIKVLGILMDDLISVYV